eukprot:13515843-Alexandrium_andersonii.AAC.1
MFFRARASPLHLRLCLALLVPRFAPASGAGGEGARGKGPCYASPICSNPSPHAHTNDPTISKNCDRCAPLPAQQSPRNRNNAVSLGVAGLAG